MEKRFEKYLELCRQSLLKSSIPDSSAYITGDPSSYAVLSEDLKHRYVLGRTWDDSLPLMAVVMLNPSTANAHQDDPTIRRLKGFATKFGYGGFEVVNCYSYRTSSPKELKKTYKAPLFGKLHTGQNQYFVEEAFSGCTEAMLGWGNNIGSDFPLKTLKEMAVQTGTSIFRLGETKSGNPKHPLYIPNSAERLYY